MTETGASRRYDGSARRQAAGETRQAILAAARVEFLAKGYGGAKMQAIASASGVALDTVYAAVGKKADLFRLMIETAISGTDQAQPADERAYVQAIRAERTARGKIDIYARALAEILPRLAPLFALIREAAPHDDQIAALWTGIAKRRAENMRRFAADLQATGALRDDLTIDRAADIVWSMNAPEYFLLLTAERGWSAQDFGDWLADAWARLLLKP